MNKILIALETMNIGRVIFFAYADGSVEYRDRVGMTETFNDNDLDRVWHLSQIGFSYSDEEPCKSLYYVDRPLLNLLQAFKLHCPLATALWCRFEMMGKLSGSLWTTSWVILDPA